MALHLRCRRKDMSGIPAGERERFRKSFQAAGKATSPILSQRPMVLPTLPERIADRYIDGAGMTASYHDANDLDRSPA